MVVPLRLTQFYGHSVPRPRIYDAVKFSEQRVDPPASVNDALLSWASDAHWSMGGLSFKRVRTQGKVEGSVRRLRAFDEEDGDAQDESETLQATAKSQTARKPAEGSVKVKSAVSKGSSLEKKRQRTEEESVEETPARKLRKREIFQDSSEGGSPTFVPATEEIKLRRKERPKHELPEVEFVHASRKNGLKSPSNEEPAETPRSETSPTEKRNGINAFAGGKKLRGSKSPASNGKPIVEDNSTGDGGRLTRSGKKPSRGDKSLLQQPSKGRPRARKILTRGSLAGEEEESSDSDDGLEAFLKEIGRPLRRSSRVVKEQEERPPVHDLSCVLGSDSDSE